MHFVMSFRNCVWLLVVRIRSPDLYHCFSKQQQCVEYKECQHKINRKCQISQDKGTTGITYNKQSPSIKRPWEEHTMDKLLITQCACVLVPGLAYAVILLCPRISQDHRVAPSRPVYVVSSWWYSVPACSC